MSAAVEQEGHPVSRRETVVTQLNQDSDEWLEFRKSRISATKWAQVLGIKGKAAAVDLSLQIGDPVTAKRTQGVFMGSCATFWGNRNEQYAIAAYAQVTGSRVHRRNDSVGYVKYLPYLSASPDAFVDDDGLLEVKCPWTSSIPSADPGHLSYVLQCHAQMMCTGRKWVDLVYMRPVLKTRGAKASIDYLNQAAALVRYRVHRSDVFLDLVEPVLTAFWSYARSHPGELPPDYESSIASARPALKSLTTPIFLAEPELLLTSDVFDPDSFKSVDDPRVSSARARPALIEDSL